MKEAAPKTVEHYDGSQHGAVAKLGKKVAAKFARVELIDTSSAAFQSEKETREHSIAMHESAREAAGERIAARQEAEKQQSVAKLASALHEDWRKTRLQEDGTFEPRIKPTKDEAWIAERGTDQVDIANSSYFELPADWQAENKAAAEVVVDVLAEANGQVDLSNEDHRDYVGTRIHDAWLSRNDWAAGGELDVPFAQLSPVEQAKDLDQMVMAQQVLQQPTAN